ncbi:MAG: carbohydrate deacetylase [Bryobacteraceae bacterium]
MKRLLINADDFGFTSDVNAGIVHAHREGILPSATLMATGDAFEDAVHLARANPSLDIGCHLVLVQGRSLITGRPFPDGPQGLIPLLLKRRLDVEAELRAQLEKMIAAGIRPTHLDAHKHTHLLPGVFRAVVRLAREFRVPFVRVPFARRYYRRIALRQGVYTTDHFFGFGLTGSLTEQTLATLLRRLPSGVTELMCHPGYLGPELKQAQTRLKESRLRELEALTSPRIRALIADLGIELASFRRAE